MGEIRKYVCKCGYEKELNIGGGLLGCNVEHIARFFPVETETFKKERAAGMIQSFMMENELSYCPRHGGELMAVEAFSYTKKDGSVCHYVRPCPECGGKVIRLMDEENVVCPRCGEVMKHSFLGDWD